MDTKYKLLFLFIMVRRGSRKLATKLPESSVKISFVFGKHRPLNEGYPEFSTKRNFSKNNRILIVLQPVDPL